MKCHLQITNTWQITLGLLKLVEAQKAINICWQYLPTFSTAKCEFARMCWLFSTDLCLSPHRQKWAEATIIHITEKEIQQECTGSPLLFALAVRVTAEKIRSDTISRGIK